MPGLPAAPTELGGVATAAALVLVTLHAVRALGFVRAGAELLALGLFLSAGGARPVLPLATALVVAVACMSLAAWLWWLSPLGRSLSAAVLASAVALSLAPIGVTVRSSTDSSDPSRRPSRMVRVISRLRRVA